MKKLLILISFLIFPIVLLSQSNYGLKFDGNYGNQYAEKASANMVTVTNNLTTMEFWVKPTKLNIHNIIADLHCLYTDGSAQQRRLTPYISVANEIKIYANASPFHTSNALDISTGVTVSLDRWYHIAITIYRGYVTAIYINGEYKTGGMSPAFNMGFAFEFVGTWYVNLGREYWPVSGTPQYGYVILDEFRIWNEIRSQENILNNMYDGFSATQTNLNVYYKMNEGSETTLTDLTGNSNSATIYNNATWVDGYELVTPTTQATDIVFSNIYSDRMGLIWTNGDGDRRVVFAKQGTTGTATPVNLNTYTANSNFGTGTQVGDWYCIYDGTGNQASINNLSANTSYCPGSAENGLLLNLRL